MDILENASEKNACLCTQCGTIDFNGILDHMASLGQGEAGDIIVQHRQGIDAECKLCKLLMKFVLPGTYVKVPEPGSEIRWQLRAISIRCMLVESRTMNLFRPAAIALLHAGEADRDYIKNNDSEMVERIGYLAFGRSKELNEAMPGNITEPGIKWPQTGFITKHYDVELAKHWLQYPDGLERESWEYSSIEESEDDDKDVDDNEGICDIQSQNSLIFEYGPVELIDEESDGGSVELAEEEEEEEEEEEQLTDIVGMFVIDCQTSEVVKRTPEMCYVTLSYVWKLAHEDMVPMDICPISPPEPGANKTLPSVIPRVVHNAIQVTGDLGYRYLWVDQFCIDQSAAKEEIANNISKMDLIYSLAEVTIVAASSRGALPGVGSTRRVEQVRWNITHPDEKLEETEGKITIFSTPPPLHFDIMKQVWFSRGWCFQESLLSSRRLYFTDHQMFFEADDIHCCDTYPMPGFNVDLMLDDDFGDNPSLAWPKSWEERLDKARRQDILNLSDHRDRFWLEANIFLNLVQVYSGKDLTDDSDSLDGFRGAMKVFSRNDPLFHVVQGHPILDVSATKKEDGCWNTFQRRAFMLSLSWTHTQSEAGVIRRRPEFPSWSWAGWKGTVEWRSFHRNLCENDPNATEMEIKAIESLGGELVRLDKTPQYFEQHFNPPKYLIIDALILTGQVFDIQTKDEEHTRLLMLKGDWKLLKWDMNMDFYSVSSPENTESLLIQHIMDGTWGCLVMYTKTFEEKHVRPDDIRPPYDEARIMVVCWEPDKLSSSNPSKYRDCSRMGLVTFRKRRALGSLKSGIPETFGRLEKGSFRLG